MNSWTLRDYDNRAALHIASSNRTSPTSKRSRPYSSESALIPGISTISRTYWPRPARSSRSYSAASGSLRIWLRDLAWQTDNGGEFKGDFPKALGDSQHGASPPGAHTYQSFIQGAHLMQPVAPLPRPSAPAIQVQPPAPAIPQSIFPPAPTARRLSIAHRTVLQSP